jgi:hypothetical protein
MDGMIQRTNRKPAAQVSGGPYSFGTKMKPAHRSRQPQITDAPMAKRRSMTRPHMSIAIAEFKHPKDIAGPLMEQRNRRLVNQRVSSSEQAALFPGEMAAWVG